MKTFSNSFLFTLLLLLFSPTLTAHTFEVSYPLPTKKPVFTPRVYIVISQGFRSPRSRMRDWANLPTMFAVDDLDNDGKVTIDKDSLSTIPMLEVEGNLKVQAEPQKLTFHADKVVEAPTFRTEGLVQDHYFKSEKLSKFHGRDYQMRYSVILPDDWNPEQKYPVIIYVTGYTAVHQSSTRRIKRTFGEKGKKAIIVIADANCRWGHSVFANSVVNGPWGDALTYELLPHIDQKYSGAGAAHRYITGVSSGGWTAAWAITNYPDAYAEAWPVAPDPVDFEKFQELNLVDQKPDNLFTTTEQEEQVARCISLPQLGWTFQNMANFEHVLGAGGQLTDAWAPYNIALLLESNWKKLEPKLKGKMHFGIHSTDMFHLDHSVRSLEIKCKQLGSDATFSYFEGQGHHLPPSHAEKMMDSILKRWNEHRIQ